MRWSSANVTEHSYSTDIEGGAPVRRRFVIAGRMRIDDYLRFVAERARWFGINGWIGTDDQRRVTLVADGPEAMVGALEMACTLGPITALIDSVEISDETLPVGTGFELHQK